MSSTTAGAWAPASVGNACVGFDVLGFSFPVVGDTAVLERRTKSGPGRVETVEIVSREVGEAHLPTDPGRNTASVALQALLDQTNAQGVYHLRLQKAIPLSAGMGGSAASAVAAVVAGNQLLAEPLPREELLPFALEGEKVASGGYHADNVAPCLLGGLTATGPGRSPRVVHLPVPPGIVCVLAHPHVRIDTRDAREALGTAVPLAAFVEQSAHLAFFMEALRTGDLGLLRASMRDVVVEPQRRHLIPGFAGCQQAAWDAGALGCSISGAGPSVFAWTTEQTAPAVRDSLVSGFRDAGVDVDTWIGPAGGQGARVVAA